MLGRRERKKESRSVMFTIAVVLLGLLLAGMAVLFVVRINRSFYTYRTEPNALLRMLNRGEYIEAWREVQNNRESGETELKNAAYALPYAVVDYYEAESYYTVYQHSGDTEKSRKYREAMDRAYENMGELQFMAEEIDAMLTEQAP